MADSNIQRNHIGCCFYLCIMHIFSSKNLKLTSRTCSTYKIFSTTEWSFKCFHKVTESLLLGWHFLQFFSFSYLHNWMQGSPTLNFRAVRCIAICISILWNLQLESGSMASFLFQCNHTFSENKINANIIQHGTLIHKFVTCDFHKILLTTTTVTTTF